MKKFLLFFAITLIIVSSCTSDKTTTYYLIRHAEKERKDTTNKNPDLNDKGKERAKKWVNYFKDIHLDAIYSTHYNRTQQTVKPTADSKNLDILSYNPNKLNDAIFKQNTTGKTILVVGHSNTTPMFVNAILKEKKYKWMKDDDNSSLYIVTLRGDKKTSTVLKIDN